MRNYKFKNIVTDASAGAGKTFKLSERYLKLILLDEKVDSILATTFTRKAAGEIQNRILMRLGKGALDKDGAQALYKELTQGDPQFAPKANLTEENAQSVFRQKLSAVVQELDRFRVCTLDSFFMKLAGGYAFEIGLPPNWKIVEDVENARLLYGALLASFAQAQNNKTPQCDSPATTLARDLFKGELKRNVESQISDLMGNVMQIYYESKPEDWNRFDEVLAPVDLDFDKVAQDIEAEIALVPIKDPSKTPMLVEKLNELQSKLNLKDYDSILDLTIIKNCAPPKSKTECKFGKSTLPEKVAGICQEVYEWARQAKFAEVSKRLHTTWGTVNFVSQYFEKAKYEKGAYRFDDLARILVNLGLENKLTQLVYRLDARTSHILLDEFQDASDTQWNIIKPFVCSILNKDSNGSFFCVGDVKQAIYSWRGGRAEIFESIKDPEVSGLTTSVAGNALETGDLLVNYRSCQTIVDVVNKLFLDVPEQSQGLTYNKAFDCKTEPILDDPRTTTYDDIKKHETTREAQATWSKRFKEHSCKKAELSGYWALEQAPKVDKAGKWVNDYTPIPYGSDSQDQEEELVDVQVGAEDDFDFSESDSAETKTDAAKSKTNSSKSSKETDKNKIDWRYRNHLQEIVTLNYAVKRIAQLRIAYPTASIGVLLRTNNYGAKIVAKLKEELKDTGFEISEEGGSPLSDAPSVNAALSVLQVAAHSGDHVASFHIANTAPLAERFNITLDNYKSVCPQAFYIRKLIETKGLGDFLSDVRDLLKPICVDDRSFERLEQLVEFAYRYEKNAEKVLLDDFIEAAREYKVESASQAQLRVMTLHKSKGLEFDIVVLPELDDQIDDFNDAFFVHRPSPTENIDGIAAQLPLSLLNGLPESCSWIEESMTNKLKSDIEEALSLLYVGITRPIRALIAIVPPDCQKGKTLTFAKILYQGLNAKLNSNTLRAQILYKTGDENWKKEKVESPEQQEYEQRPLFKALGAPKSERTERLLFQRETPSGGHERRDWSAASSKATQKGTAIHACFEHTMWLDEGARPSDQELEKVLKPLVAQTSEIKSYIKQFHKLCDLESNKRLLSRSSYSPSQTQKVLREREFSCELDDGKLVRGSIDRLVLIYDGDRIVEADVIDFKTNERQPGETYEQYDSQLRLYGKAVRKLYGLAPEAIKMRYFFVGEDWPDEERERLVEFC